MSMYSNYNKGGAGTKAGGVRLGNWQEEVALETTTGYSRSAPPKTKAYYNNHERTIAHSDCSDPAGFMSTAQAAMSQAGGGVSDRKVGPRDARRKQKQMEQALREAEEAAAEKLMVKNKINYNSQNSSTYSLEDNSISRLSNPSKSSNLFGGDVTKASLEAKDIAMLPPGDYSKATSVSYWTQQLTNPDKVTDFPITSGTSSNPFSRSSTFTNDIRDSTLHHSEAADLEGLEHMGKVIGMDRQQMSVQVRKDFHAGTSFPSW